jgi:hypothetical protein
MAATGSDPARSGATGVGRSVAGPTPLPGDGPSALAAPLPSAPVGDDWATQTADAIERVVGTIRSKTAEPLEGVARALVYGLVAVIVGLAATVLAAVALVRVLDLILPGAVWSAHALTGGIFTLAGLLLWRKRTVKTVKV